MRKTLLRRRYIFLLLLTFLMVLSCRNDHFLESEGHGNSAASQLKSKIVSLEKTLHKNKLVPLLAESEHQIKGLSSQLGGKSATEDDLSLDTENIIYIENGPNYHTYTFRVIHEDPSADLQNLVMGPLTDGSYERFLVTYHLTDAEKVAVAEDRYVDTTGKMDIVYLEDADIPTTGSGSNLSSECKWVEVGHALSCSSGEHGSWNMDEWGECEAEVKPLFYTTMIYQCTEQDDPEQPGTGGGGSTEGGGGGSNTNTNPCNGGANTDPQNPNGGTGRQSCTGVPTQVNVVKTDPCEKTKALLANVKVANAVQDLKGHIAAGTGGEKGWKINKTGDPTQTTENSDHSVNFGDPSQLTGGYHNHTGTKVDMFSATDISTMIEIARNQTMSNGVSNAGNGFLGIIAPNGVHYVIRFDGNHTDLPPNGFSSFDLDGWNVQQTLQMFEIIKKSEYSQTVNGKKILNNKGLERVFFKTIENMNLQNNFILQKIDNDNKISTINKNSDGTTIAVPCA